MLKTKILDLVTDAIVQPAAHDPEKPYLAGRVSEKTVNGFQAVGAPLTKYHDTFTEFAFTPGGVEFYDEVNQRLFILSSVSTAGVGQILLYDFDPLTNKLSNGRRIGFNISGQAATTHVLKEMDVVYLNPTTMRIFLTTTGSIVNNGGPFLINNVEISDFIAGPGFPVFVPAFGDTDGKKIYKLTTTAQPGILNVPGSGAENVAVSTGHFVESGVLKVFNGAATSLRMLHFDTAVNPVHTISTVTLNIASPGLVNHAGHNFQNGDLVTFQTTGALPTGLTPFPTVFAIRNAIAGVSYNVSTTASATPIAFTGTQSGVHSVGRAWGETTNLYLGTSGDLVGLVPGTITATRNARLKTEPFGPNAGQNYVFFSTTSHLNKVKTAQFAIGSSTFTSLEQVTVASPNLTAASVLQSAWEDNPLVNKYLFVTNVAKVVEKDFLVAQNNRVFGSVFNDILENKTLETVNFGGPAVLSMTEKLGFLFLQINTVGARGIIIMDYRSDAAFNYSYILSPVLKTKGEILCFTDTIEALFESTGTVRLYYKTAGFDGTFVEGPAANQYKEISIAEELSIPLEENGEVMFAVKMDIALNDASTPAQLMALKVSLMEKDAQSEHWVGNPKHSSGVGISPFYVSFRLQHAYESGVIPELNVFAYDDNGNEVLNFNTVTHAANFSYSTNDGLTWVPLGTIPNTALTTHLRCLINTPPSGYRRVVIRES